MICPSSSAPPKKTDRPKHAAPGCGDHSFTDLQDREVSGFLTAAIAWGRLGAVAGPLVGGLLLQGGASPGAAVYAMAPYGVVAGFGVLLLTYLTKAET